MNKYFRPTLVAIALALAAGPAAATDVFLAAKPFTKSLPMADGTMVDVPMWGYVEDAGGLCFGEADAALRQDCVDALPVPALPGPRIALDPADPTLTILLTNGLPEATSIVIPGQAVPPGGPTWNDGSTGPRGADLDKRVRSFGPETPAGGTGSYAWTLDRPGTFIYHSGTHPQKQVYMGLYGAVTMDAVAADPGDSTVDPAVPPSPAVAYNDPADGVTPLASTTYDNEVVLFYSDVDPDLNTAIAGGSYTTSIEMNARWFLVNGEPFAGDKTAAGMTIDAGSAKAPTLVRFLSAASETHVPTLQGLHMTLHAEDGLVYNYQDDTGAHAAPRTQYSVKLPPLKTMDAVIVPQSAGTYAVYDGNGYMTNPSDIGDFTQGDTVGGMLRFLAVAADGNELPVVADDTAEAVEGRTITIDVLANDSDPEGLALAIDGFDANGTQGGTVSCDTAVPGGSCTYTAPTPAPAVPDTFTYTVTDGVNVLTGPATVTITVVANEAPVAVDDTASTEADTAVTIDVLANDSDPNGDALTVVSTTAPTGGIAVVNADNTVTYTPNTGFSSTTDSFTYTVEDVDGLSATATVTVTVNPAAGNTAPVAAGDSFSIGEDTALNVAAPGVLGNDTDAENDPLTAVLVSGPSHGTLTAFNPDGSFRYVPNNNYVGSDSFTYVANDGTADSNTAIVSIDVTAVNNAPVAVNDTFFLKSMYAPGQVTSIGAPGVLRNDTDLEGDPLTAKLVAGVEPDAVLTLGADGSLTYTTGDIGNLTIGPVDTFTYVANDGAFDSNEATVTLTRKLAVSEAVCEWEAQQGGRCDWRIQGTKLDAASQTIQAWYGSTLIGSATAGSGAWTITRNNFTAVRPPVGTSISVDVRVVGDSNAEILAYPTVSQ